MLWSTKNLGMACETMTCSHMCWLPTLHTSIYKKLYLVLTHRGHPAGAPWHWCPSRWGRSSGTSLSLTGWRLWSRGRWRVGNHGSRAGCASCGTRQDAAGQSSKGELRQMFPTLCSATPVLTFKTPRAAARILKNRSIFKHIIIFLILFIHLTHLVTFNHISSNVVQKRSLRCQSYKTETA